MTDVRERLESQRGYFSSRQRLRWYLEELLNVDIDGDKIIGEVDPSPDDETSPPPRSIPTAGR